jgi:type I restriction enzyme S subunit
VSANTNINQDNLKKLLIALAPLPEQRAIATALSDVDGLLGGLDRLIAKKRDLKQAAMQQLLTGQTRLPGFHCDWESVRLGDVADPNRSWSFTGGPFGSNLKSSDYTESGVRIIQLQNIGDGEFKDDYEIYTSIAKADELLSCNIYPGEIILSKMGDPVARACIIPTSHSRYLMCSDGIRLAVDSSRFANNFVFAQINAPDFRNRAANVGTGSTRKRIGLTELRDLKLHCPPSLAEQTAIAEVLTEMDEELAGLEQRQEKTRALKQAMMQELLTGRTRLV